MMQPEQTAAAVRDQIVETARTLFNDQGFEQTTIDDILLRLGMEEQRLSHYFHSLDEILEVIWSGQ